MIVLDPDFDTYAIPHGAKDGNSFTFLLFNDDHPIGAIETVHCYEYNILRGTFKATRGEDGFWEAVRV